MCLRLRDRNRSSHETVSTPRTRPERCPPGSEVGLPRFLTYIVSFTCNARCIMCDSWKKPSPEDLTIEEIERIFRELPTLDLVRLSGGEPFARGDLLEIARLAQDLLRPIQLHITSNGFLTDRIIRFLRTAPKARSPAIADLARRHGSQTQPGART